MNNTDFIYVYCYKCYGERAVVNNSGGTEDSMMNYNDFVQKVVLLSNHQLQAN